MINKTEYVELGLACADVCAALGRGLNGKSSNELDGSERSDQTVDGVSYIRDATVWVLVDEVSNCKTVAEIQRKVLKRSKRNALSRLFHARNDKETIASRRLDLNRILLVFNVRSVTLGWLLLSLRFQTELAVNTHVSVVDLGRDVTNTRTAVSDIRGGIVETKAIVSDVHCHVVGAHTIVSELQHSATDTHILVSDIHRNMLQSQEGTDRGQQSVSGGTTYSSKTDGLQSLRLKLGQ